MPASIVGLDIAKNIFQIHGVDAKGRVVLRKRLRRSQLTDFFANIPVCVIGMESTRGAHYWSRVLGTFGHTIRLIAPQFVKPYLKKAAKNDANDAAAICEAVSRPHMRFVPQKSVAQQDLQCLHRVRRRLIGCRTQLGNQIRGLLSEYGIEIAQHLSQVRRVLPALIDPGEDRLWIARRPFMFPPAKRQNRFDELSREWKLAQEKYNQIGQRFDELNAQVRTRTHGMVAPDGLQAIINLGNERRQAFEQYRQALQVFSDFILEHKDETPNV